MQKLSTFPNNIRPVGVKEAHNIGICISKIIVSSIGYHLRTLEYLLYRAYCVITGSLCVGAQDPPSDPPPPPPRSPVPTPLLCIYSQPNLTRLVYAAKGQAMGSGLWHHFRIFWKVGMLSGGINQKYM